MLRLRRIGLGLVIGFGFLTLWLPWPDVQASEPPSSPPVSFVREIRPILARDCFACHGPDEAQRKAKLRLDRPAEAFGEREGNRAFVPGSLSESEAYQRIVSEDPVDRMPSGEGSHPLSPEQIELFKRWIEQGAKWEEHWAFEPLSKPTLPEVDDPEWSKLPIDRFVFARLKAEGLNPSPEADPSTLIQRVAQDLTGLPPSLTMVEGFAKNPSPEAYEAIVETLLADPAYGERWARVWLDLARYADTKGYEKDLKRSIFRYRDWVIASFNADKPYDQFSIEQLAGDLLPNATPDQRLATAFHRNTLTNDEGGTDNEEFRIAAVKDRLDTTGQVWLGLTVGCAKCHSHKYDPISHREYYQLYSFFNQTTDNDQGDDAPNEPFPDPTQKARLDTIASEIQRKETALKQPTSERLEALKAWEDAQKAKPWRILNPMTAKAASGSEMLTQGDRSILVRGEGPEAETYKVVYELPAQNLQAIRLEVLPDSSLPKKGSGRSKDDGNFVLTAIQGLLIDQGGHSSPLNFAKAEADFAQDQYPVEHSLKNPEAKKHGWAISPRLTEPHAAVYSLDSPVAIQPGTTLELTLDHQFAFSYPGFSIGRFRIAITDQASLTTEPEPPTDILAILELARDKRSPEQTAKLLAYHVERQEAGEAERAAIEALKHEQIQITNDVNTPIFRELPDDKKRVSKIHLRGNFLDPGEVVEPATPGSFSKFPEGSPKNRLGLATWFFRPENPLTARVAVNRHWAIFFGRGLVETQEDFGSQGQGPSHPELLDWLADSFREHKWSMKELAREIVRSKAYKQASKVSPALAQRDPNNRLIGRGPRFRLEAETIRDKALAASGLLSRKMFGPSVMPIQPEGIWRSTYNTDQWMTSPGEDRHRRSLYTFIKRTSPYPGMTAFDAPSRELCTVRRIATNTPLQALVTLNDPVYLEAAQGLARRMLAEGGASLAEQLRWGWKIALLRDPQPRELEALATLYQQRRMAFDKDPEGAKVFATEPIGPLPEKANPSDLAALTALSNVILNLDEFLNRN